MKVKNKIIILFAVLLSLISCKITFRRDLANSNLPTISFMFGGNLKYGNKYQEDIYRSMKTRRQTIQRHLVKSGLFSSVSFGLTNADYLAEFYIERNLELDVDIFTDKHDLPIRPDIKIKGVKLHCSFRNTNNDLIFEKEYIGTEVGGIGVIIPSYVLSASRFIQMQLIFDTLIDKCIQDFSTIYKENINNKIKN